MLKNWIDFETYKKMEIKPVAHMNMDSACRIRSILRPCRHAETRVWGQLCWTINIFT